MIVSRYLTFSIVTCTSGTFLASRAYCRSGDYVLVVRPILGVGLDPLECHECQIRVASALVIRVFVCPLGKARTDDNKTKEVPAIPYGLAGEIIRV